MTCLVSGGEHPEGFTRGWALRVLNREKAHIWQRRRAGGDIAFPVCAPERKIRARLGNGQLALFGPGDFPKCARCLRIEALEKVTPLRRAVRP